MGSYFHSSLEWSPTGHCPVIISISRPGLVINCTNCKQRATANGMNVISYPVHRTLPNSLSLFNRVAIDERTEWHSVGWMGWDGCCTQYNLALAILCLGSGGQEALQNVVNSSVYSHIMGSMCRQCFCLHRTLPGPHLTLIRYSLLNPSSVLLMLHPGTLDKFSSSGSVWKRSWNKQTWLHCTALYSLEWVFEN